MTSEYNCNPGINNVTIIITTKDRFDDLTYTLNQLYGLGMGSQRILIVDDASVGPIADSSTMSKFINLSVFRNEVSQGLIANRNFLAKVAVTDFVCSLDDDSCFVELPNFDSVEKYFLDNNHVVGLEFNNVDVNCGERAKDVKSSSPVQMYTGCGHILRRSTFLELGGYVEEFTHMCEEREFAMRCYKSGLEIHSFYSIVVHHLRSPISRNPVRNAYFMIRNTIIFNYLHTPLLPFMGKVVGILPYQILRQELSLKMIIGLVKGWFAGIVACFSRKFRRRAMTSCRYKYFRSLPIR